MVPNKKSIKLIKPVRPAETAEPANEVILPSHRTPKSPIPPRSAGLDNRKESNSKLALWLVAIVAFVFLLFSVSVLFTSAKVAVLPKVKDLVLDEELVAKREAASGDLGFDVMTLTDEETKVLKATKQVDVEKKARGKAVLYNSFSTEPQKLLIETRLEGGNGKIYKTDAPVTIPGSTVKDGQIVPGSIEVGITAAEAGEDYNSSPVDFNIVGFKGTPKYSKIYARSKGDIAGGFKGLAYVIDEEEAKKVSSDLQGVLKSRMLTRAKAEIPAGFILYDKAVFLDFDDVQPRVEAKESDLPITAKATLTAILFNRDKLTDKLLESAGKKEEEGDFYIAGLESLDFILKDGLDLSSPELKEIIFGLSGRTKTVSKVDSGKLAADLLGIKKKEFRRVLAGYPNIDQAEVTIKPFWRSTFPENPKKIKILVKEP